MYKLNAFIARIMQLLLPCLLHSYALAADQGGLQSAVAVDILGQNGTVQEGKADRLDIREAELILFSPIDHIFDGTLNLAAHNEAGESFFEIHEAALSSSKLIPRSRIRIGRYFLGIGRLNQAHRHDWPFVSAPKVQRDFFDKEGLNDTGFEYSTVLPLSFFLELTAGVASGWTFGHTHNEGEKPQTPIHYLRAATYSDLSSSTGIQTGLNYLGRTAANGTQQSYWGLDITAKKRAARFLAFLLQSEVWLRTLTPSGANAEKTLGAYIFPQYGFNENWFFGIRGDYFSVLDLKDATGSSVENNAVAVVPTLTYKSSEFATFRIAYNNEWKKQPVTGAEKSGFLELQATFILGAHPAHDF